MNGEPPAATPAAARGVLLLAHGSRDAQWHHPVQALATRLARLAPDVPARCAYLELSQPDLPTAAAELVALGCTRIDVFPLFLGMGRHAREDLPRLMAALRARFPAVSLHTLPALGEDARVLDLLARIALDGLPPEK